MPLVSYNVKDSNAKVENVERPPQKPTVHINFRYGGILAFVSRYENKIPKAKLAIILTINVP